jgi:hypothetical protein
MGRSWWYTPGDWALPRWWTDDPPARAGYRCTHAEQAAFYGGRFVREVLGHTGGITCTPEISER